MIKRPNIRSEQGQTMVEFVLVLPVLMVVLFGIVQFGLAFNNYVALTDSVRAGARTAAVSAQTSDPVGITTTRVKTASGDLNSSKVNVTVSAPSGWVHGNDVVVTATYPYSISLFGVVVANGNLSSKTTERIE